MKKNLNTSTNYRECSECGDPTSPYENQSGGPIRFKKICNRCKLQKSKLYIFDTCTDCGDEKEPNNRRKCNQCQSEYNRLAKMPITGEELVEIKRWVEKQIKFDFMTDLNGLNEMITIYLKICRSIYDYSAMAGNKQLDKMWKIIWKFYNDELKDVPEKLLINMISDRSTKKLVNKKKASMHI